MEGLILAILLIQGIVFGFFSAYIANEKGRSYKIWFILGFFFSVLAILALIAVPRIDSPTVTKNDVGGGIENAKTSKNLEPNPPDYSGSCDTNIPEYQLYLTKRFDIEKNLTLNKFIVQGKVFDDLEQALIYADSQYKKILEEKRLGEEQRRKREQEFIEQRRKNEKALIEQEKVDRKLEWERRAFEEARKEARRKELIKTGKLLFGALVGSVILYLTWEWVEELQDQKVWNSEGLMVQDCETCPQMIRIPSGSFVMGIPKGEIGHSIFTVPEHKVKVKSFLIGRTEITQGQWQAIMETNPSLRTGSNDYPVENVSWIDVQIFVKKLSEKTGKLYRLPSEAEWEYAARAGSKTPWSFGSDEKDLDLYAWYSQNSTFGAQLVAKKKPNKIGLHDVHGNVSEWVHDMWHDDYREAPNSAVARDTGGTNPDFRVVRGGSYLSKSEELASGNRTYRSRFEGSGGIGFRVVRED